jgi:hypothetical protein
LRRGLGVSHVMYRKGRVHRRGLWVIRAHTAMLLNAQQALVGVLFMVRLSSVYPCQYLKHDTVCTCETVVEGLTCCNPPWVGEQCLELGSGRPPVPVHLSLPSANAVLRGPLHALSCMHRTMAGAGASILVLPGAACEGWLCVWRVRACSSNGVQCVSIHGSAPSIHMWSGSCSPLRACAPGT